MVGHLENELSKRSTLEQDVELLKRGDPSHPGQPIHFELRMAVVYRAEKKKILRSQLHLLGKVLSVLDRAENALTSGPSSAKAYHDLILEETPTEAQWREAILSAATIQSEKTKTTEIEKLEKYYYYRRVINSSYWKQIKDLVESGTTV